MAAEPTPREDPAVRQPRLELRVEERIIAALAHFSTLVPLWALIANALLLFAYRESSRAVCFHARQGIQFQVLFLMLCVPILLMRLLEKLLSRAHVSQLLPADLDPGAMWWALGIIYSFYAACCLLGIVQALRGRFFLYPLTGRALYRRMAGLARASS